MQKTQKLYVLRNLTISVFQSHSTAHLLQFGDKKFSNSKPDTSVKLDIINW